MDSDELASFQSALAKWANRYSETSLPSNGSVALPGDFHPDEAAGFFRALNAGIVSVSDSGRCTLPTVHRATARPTEPCLFSRRRDGSIYLAWREYITQVGAVASLILDYGWPTSLVALDPRTLEFDVGGFASPARDAWMVVAGETKKTQRELDRLMVQIDAASRSADMSVRQTVTDGQKKYRGILKERPKYFWAVAPGARRSFRVIYERNSVFLDEMADLPSYSAIFADR
jgi:hypothetical protein